MKILITGASGYIGTILREIFENDEVTLLSRKTLTTRRNERWFTSGNLQNDCWWCSLPTDSFYDVVFHLAEPVKKNSHDDRNQNIIEGHINFIEYSTKNGAKVIYPLTAYLYDTKLSPSDKIYADIKHAVYCQLRNNEKVSFPVIHPICDSGHGLGKLIQIEKKIPFINVLCAFNATMPILRFEDLKRVLSDPISMIPGRSDLYSEILPIREIFKDEARANILFISRGLLFSLMRMVFSPGINLLVKGRKLGY